ncbi:hypothetical protein [Clostridium thermarum]|uniref:hypothetical protein n=1 Tax=Clostridium thermarum TaxID=1716543 RepID=UPI00111DB5C6|nr:hypothetical protein [Clostridium thermarum]
MLFKGLLNICAKNRTIVNMPQSTNKNEIDVNGAIAETIIEAKGIEHIAIELYKPPTLAT